MTNDLIRLLQRLGDAEIDDLSIAHDALEEIVSLRIENERLRDELDVMKAQEPVVCITPDGEGWRLRFETPIKDVPLGWTALYDKPTPPSAPDQKTLTDEQILELAEPFGAFEYGDAQGHKRIAFARAILAAKEES